MRKDEYIASAVSKISNRKAKRETEAELAEHIDELTESYLDRNMTAEEAEQRAVADMGTPESVSSSLGKLHTGAGKRVYIALLILMSFFGICETFGLANVFYNVEALHLHRLLYYGDSLLESKFLYADAVTPFIILVILVVIGYHRCRPILEIVFAVLLFSTTKGVIFMLSEDGMYWFPLSLLSTLPQLTLLIIALALLLLLYREEDMLNGYEPKDRVFKVLLRVFVTVAILTLASVCYSNLLELVSELKSPSS